MPLALVGGIWLLYLLSYHLSVAGTVGFIALLYLKQAWDERIRQGKGARKTCWMRSVRVRGAERAAEGHDGGREPGGFVPDHAGYRHRK